MGDSNKISESNEMPDKAESKRAVIEGLRTHFVFNSINVIRYLVRTDPDKAYTALYDLAQFIRERVESTVTEGMIPLSDELSYARSYLNLEQVQRRLLIVKWTVQDEEGYVPCGSISTTVAQLLKNDPESNRKARTLTLETNVNEKKVRIYIGETGEKAEIPVSGRDEQLSV